jgi:hypothetical protein
MLMGFEKIPRFQGPGLNRLPPENSFNAIGSVKDVYWPMAPFAPYQFSSP